MQEEGSVTYQVWFSCEIKLTFQIQNWFNFMDCVKLSFLNKLDTYRKYKSTKHNNFKWEKVRQCLVPRAKMV